MGIIILYLLIIIPVLSSGFFIWDDQEFLFSVIITLSNWLEVFYRPHYGLYHPVTTGYIKLNFLLHQNNPIILHLGNVVLHLVNSLLLYQILRKLGFNGILGFVIFLFHPLTAEVAFWITSIKDLLLCLFSFLAIQQYITYLKDNTNKRSYFLSFLFVILALLSKIQGVFLPIVLMVFDYYFTRKILSKRIVLHIILTIIGVALVFVNLHFRRFDSDLSTLPSFDQFTRLVVASQVFTEYFVSVFMPIKLSVFYPFSFNNSIPIFSRFSLYLLFPLIYTLSLILAWRKGNYLLVLIMVLYVISLLPVLQFFQIRESMRNDRYAYFSLFSVAFFIEYLFKLEKLGSLNIRKMVKVTIPLFVIMLLLLFTFRILLWQEPKKLITCSYDEYPKSEILANTLGVIYLKENDREKALQYLNKAISLAPDYAQPYYNRGLLFEKFNDNSNAISSYKQAISINPNYVDAAFRLGQIFFINDEIDEARNVLMVIDKQYLNAPLLDLMGKIEYRKGNIESSITYSKTAIKLEPSNVIYLYNYALALGSASDFTEALKILNKCIKLNPSFVEAYYLRGITKIKLGMNGCDDLNKAEAMGNAMAQSALKAFCR